MAQAWPQERIESLKALWPTHSAKQISEIFTKDGFEVTRNSVIGRAHRLQLGTVDKTKRHSHDNSSPRPVNKADRIATIRSAPVARQRVSFIPRIIHAPPLLLTLLELTDVTCKYECTNADHPSDYRFCGHPIHKGSYCGAHYALCQHPAAPPRDRAYVGGRRAA